MDRNVDISAVVRSAISRTPKRQSLTEFFLVCRKIAEIYLRRRILKGRLDLRFFSVHTVEDLATDCIADLFQQDEQGCLLQVRSYFEGVDPDAMSPEITLQHLRRLVCGRVQQSLFRLYGEIDPSFAKIIRNIKLAVQSLNNFELRERMSESYLIPSIADPADQLPEIPHEQLEQILFQLLRPSDTIPGMLAKISLWLREQSDYSRCLPLFRVAVSIRSVYTGGFEQSTVVEPNMEERLLPQDVVTIVRQECEKLKNEMEPRYVGRGTISPDLFRTYFTAVETTIIEGLCGTGNNGTSLFENFALRHGGQVSREEYRREHRTKIEYFQRIILKRARKQLRHILHH
jgi:hypothetical protein